MDGKSSLYLLFFVLFLFFIFLPDVIVNPVICTAVQNYTGIELSSFLVSLETFGGLQWANSGVKSILFTIQLAK